VISDWSLPRFSALDALDVLKQSGKDLPFIIASGTIGEESAVVGMRAGAHDYVLKSNLKRLGVAIEREVRDHADRTARRAAEQALRESEARYRRIVETTSDGVVVTDVNATLTYVNDRAAAMLGYDAAELLGRPLVELVPAETCADMEAMFAQQEQGVAVHTERTFVRKEGRRICVHIDSAAIFDNAGRYEGRLAMLRDVTARRDADEALRVSEARLARLAESGLMGIIVANSSGAIVEANDTFLAMLGYARADVAAGALDWAKLTPPEWSTHYLIIGDELRLHGRSAPREKEYLRKDGTRVPVLVGVATLDPPYAISIAIDLSDRKRAERQLRETEDQLLQAQKMEAVGRLAGGVAHDFNNLLSVILTCSEFLLDEMKPHDPMREDAEEIQKAAQRAANLTRQLLLFSRQQVIEPKVLDLNVLLTEMHKLLERVLGEDVELQTRTARSLGRVMVDPTSIEQVVMNLVVNARDAMPKGGKLTIETGDVVLDDEFARTHIGVELGPHVMLAVSDNGVGMDKATVARIFEPFFTTKEMGKGTGLGLSTVFGIVKQSGGTVWVYSEPQHGTTFKVFLPRIDAPTDVIQSTLPPATLRGSETILLVEDEAQVRAVARGILVRRGYDVLEASNAGEALLLCERHPSVIHMLLTDVVMPQMSGPELAKRLARERPCMKVLCMSGYTDDSIVRHGVLEQHFAFLQKPITPDTLTRKVREVLDAPVETPTP
jgi:two-component system cell cycle sensor histidine kinase/response regulator CckA